MKYKYIALIISSMLLIFTLYSSCKKEASVNIIGAYTRTQTYGNIAYQVKLTFSENNVMKWEPIDSIPGHTATTLNYNSRTYCHNPELQCCRRSYSYLRR